jgi:hypothetical protein
MPDRIVRASILTSESVAKLSFGAEVFYRRLFSLADDYGRFDGRESILRAALYPLQLSQVTENKITGWIGETVNHGLSRCYTVDGKKYLEIQKFNQRIQGKPKYPPPEGVDELTVNHGDSPGKTASRARTSPSPNANKGECEGEAVLPFDSADFAAAWEEWIAHRREIRKPLTPRQTAGQLERLAACGERNAIAMIRHTISQGWQGLRAPDKSERVATGTGIPGL